MDLQASVSAKGHTINKVEFYQGTTLLGTSLTAPYTWTWSGVTAGNYTLKASAVYDGGYRVDSVGSDITVNGLPMPWQTKDIGQPGLAGTAWAIGSDFYVVGAGKIGSLADDFRFVYQPLSGDGWIMATISSIGAASSSGDVGIMMRESLRSDSRYVYLALSPDGTLRAKSRSSTGGATTTSILGSGTPSKVQLCVSRSGDILSFFLFDGAVWSSGSFGSIGMSPNTYIGLAAASGSGTTLLAAGFTGITTYP